MESGVLIEKGVALVGVHGYLEALKNEPDLSINSFLERVFDDTDEIFRVSEDINTPAKLPYLFFATPVLGIHPQAIFRHYFDNREDRKIENFIYGYNLKDLQL